MSPRARQAPPPVPPAPGTEPPRRPRPAPGSSSSLYNAAGGPLRRRPQPGRPARRCRRGSGPAAPAFGLPPGACGRVAGGLGPRPGIIGSRRGPQGAEEGAGAGPRAGSAAAEKWQTWRWLCPAPGPSPRLPALLGPEERGTPEASGGCQRGDLGAGLGTAAQRSSFGHLWLGVRGASGSGRGDGGEESAAWGAHLPVEGRAARGGVVMPGSSLPPPRAVGAGAAVTAAPPQCGGGAGAGEDPRPGPRGPENAGMGAAGSGSGAALAGAPGVAPCGIHALPRTHSHARGHTHAHAPPLGRCRRVLESFASAL